MWAFLYIDSTGGGYFFDATVGITAFEYLSVRHCTLLMLVSSRDRNLLGRSKIDKAREIAITLTEALMNYDGVEVCVVGHTANNHYTGEGKEDIGVCIREYVTPERKNFYALANVEALSNNMDGFAIQYLADKMIKWYGDYDSRMLIVLSDGYPAAEGYGGPMAMRHISHVCKAARAKGIEVINVCINNEYEGTSESIMASRNENYKLMYGKGNFIHAYDLKKFGKAISSLISKKMLNDCVLKG